MTIQIRVRLGTMMFLEYFIWGAWYVTLATWLTTSLHFSGQQIGLAAGTTAVGAMIAPFFVGLIADKLFATQRVLAVLHLLGGVVLLLASMQSAFTGIYSLLLLYCLCFMPTLALTNSLAFRQMTDPKLEFGPIRVLGTIGWIAAGLLVGALRLESTARPLQLAAALSLVMAVYCLTLPDTPPLAREGRFTVDSVFPKEARSLLKERSMAVFAIASFLICIPLQFYYAFTNLFLNESGVVNAAGKMTGGQMSELFCMLLIPWFFRRLGVKYMLVAGMLAWVLRYVLFAVWQCDGPCVDVVARDSAAWHLLRLFLCYGADIHRPKILRFAACGGAGVDYVYYVWGWDVCRLLALRGGGRALHRSGFRRWTDSFLAIDLAVCRDGFGDCARSVPADLLG